MESQKKSRHKDGTYISMEGDRADSQEYLTVNKEALVGGEYPFKPPVSTCIFVKTAPSENTPHRTPPRSRRARSPSDCS